MKYENVYTEKYRPKTLNDVIGQQAIVKCLKGFVKNKNMPNIIFIGPPSVGKTTCALAFAKEMFGEHWKQNFYELNASDDGGVKMMRTKIKAFAQSSSVGFKFKVVFLDESDYLTKDAQATLRRVIEKTSHICRFIFSCNFPHKIIDPISERCSEFRFSRLQDNEVETYIKSVIKTEELTITDKALKLLATKSEGSMRKPLNLLQTLKLAGETNIEIPTIETYTYWLSKSDLQPLIEGAINKSFKTIDTELKYLLFEKGYSTKDIIGSLSSAIKDSSLTPQAKLQAIDFLATIEFRISVGANPMVQLRALFARIMQLI